MRTEITETKIYTFDELSEDAKENARNWWRDGIEVEEWSEFVIDDAVEIGKLFGLEIDTKQVKLYGGGTRQDPAIYFDLYHGNIEFLYWYQYVTRSVKAVKQHAPQDKELHQIVEGLYQIQKKNFYQLRARRFNSGVDVERGDYKEPTEDAENDVTYWLQQFAEWILSRLKAEYEYCNSEEYIDETIRANEYEFTEDGSIF